MRIDALPDALLAGAALEPRAHAVGAERAAAAAAQDQRIIGGLLLLAQGGEGKQRLPADRHDARLRALAGNP